MTIGIGKMALRGVFKNLLLLTNCVTTDDSYSPAVSVSGTKIMILKGSLRAINPDDNLTASLVSVLVKKRPISSLSPAIFIIAPFISAVRPLVSLPSVFPVAVSVTENNRLL
jgi:hypothetical protein